jgi:DNA polymerase III subunit delta
MQINFQQLPAELKKKTCPIYALTGDEPLLIQEAQTLIRKHAQDNGFSQRELVFINHQFKTNSLRSITESSSLFAEKRLIDVRQQTNKIDKQTQEWLQEYCLNPAPDIILLISLNRLTAAQKKAKWVQSIANAGMLVTVWPIKPYELPQWIQKKLRHLNINADKSSIDMLAHFTEGNLLATHQAITKLSLLFPNQPITADKVKSVISDNARFNVFDFTQYALFGHFHKSQRALSQLKMSGAEPTLILWSLAKEIRLLHSIVYLKESSKTYNQIINSEWKSRQPMIKQAVSRCSLHTLEKLLQQCAQTDLCIKGLSKLNTWEQLSKITAGLCHGKSSF